MQYSSRQLTNDGDRIDAMMGILQRIRRKLQCSLVHGLLGDAFEWSLCFDISSCQRQDMFPSYSWAGWKGKVDFSWPVGDFADSESWHDTDDEASESEETESTDGFVNEGDEECESDEDTDSKADEQDGSDSSSSSPSESEYDYHTSALASIKDPDSSSEFSDFRGKATEHVNKSTWIV
jgi:hypothetical protein